MISKPSKIFVLSILILLMLPGCSKREKPDFPKTGKKDFPALELKDSIIIDMYEGSIKMWVLNTTYMKKKRIINKANNKIK